MKKTYYGTFGVGKFNSGKVQPILAENYDGAREVMIYAYGKDWCSLYEQEQWDKIKNSPTRTWALPVEMVVLNRDDYADRLY